MKHAVIASLLALVTLTAQGGAVSAAPPGPAILTTVAPITDIVRNVGGSRIDLHGLIPEGTDSHTFEPAPSYIRFIASADLIILNGLTLEVPTEKLVAANKKKSARVLKLADNTISRKEWIFDFSFPESEGNPNPHLWLNVAYAIRYAELARDALSAIDPAGAPLYRKNAEQYIGQLKRLDEATFSAVSTIPSRNRKLLTYHDSFAYFAPRYGMKVIGAIQPSSFSEPLPRDVAALIDQLRREKVPAIFGSEVFPSKVLEQIGREGQVKFIATLRDDDLPRGPDDPRHTYIGMMLENLETMVRVLGGNPARLAGVDPANHAQ